MTQNLNHTKGDTFFKSLIFKQADGTALDLTGATLTFSVKEKVEDTAFIIQETATITDATGWLAEFNILGATMDLDIGSYFYDIEYQSSDWLIATFLKWYLVISFDIT